MAGSMFRTAMAGSAPSADPSKGSTTHISSTTRGTIAMNGSMNRELLIIAHGSPLSPFSSPLASSSSSCRRLASACFVHPSRESTRGVRSVIPSPPEGLLVRSDERIEGRFDPDQGDLLP